MIHDLPADMSVALPQGDPPKNRSRRLLLICLGIILAPGLLGRFTVGQADAAPNDEGFLDYMSHHRGTVTPFTRGFLLAGDNAACADIAKGVPVDQVRVPFPGASDHGQLDLAIGASLFLCPAVQ